MAMNNNKTINAASIVTGKTIKAVALDNGHTLVISDRSRKISQDAWVVIMRASMEITVTPDLFNNVPLPGVTCEEIRAALGEKVIYEYRLERNFIMEHKKAAVLDSLVDTFMNNMGRYISNPLFPPKLVLKEYNKRQ